MAPTLTSDAKVAGETLGIAEADELFGTMASICLDAIAIAAN
jgi:hypothetical protein